jgi:putative aldouronate transport system permease protein
MQNTQNLDVSELISTYVYKQGIQKANMSFGSAVGLLQSFISLGLTCLANWIASTLTDGEIALF